MTPTPTPTPTTSVWGLAPCQEAKLKALMDSACAVFPRLYRPDGCIAAGRVLLRVLERLHVRARALPVVVEVANPVLVELIERHGRCYETAEEAQRWADAGAWQVSLGLPDTEPQPGRWPGHLVVVAWEGVVLDLTLPQCNRPAKGIRLAPVAVRVPPEWLTGEGEQCFEMNGSQIAYVARPGDRSYLTTPDWRRPDRHAAAVEAIVRRVRDELRRVGP